MFNIMQELNQHFDISKVPSKNKELMHNPKL